MASLFDVEVNTINYHLKEIYKSGEIQEEPTIRKFRIVQTEGKRQIIACNFASKKNPSREKNLRKDFLSIISQRGYVHQQPQPLLSFQVADLCPFQ